MSGVPGPTTSLKNTLAPSAPRHCLVLYGGISGERDISLATGRAVAEALKDHFAVSTLDPALGAQGWRPWPEQCPAPSFQSTENGFVKLCESLMAVVQNPAFSPHDWIIFNALHGSWGEDGRVQALLEILGIPFAGSDSAASALAMDKQRSKLIVASQGIKTAPGLCVERWQFKSEYIDLFPWKLLQSLPDIGDSEMGKWIVKPNDQGSALATRICHGGDTPTMLESLKAVFDIAHTALIERFIPGHELSVGILDQQSLPAIEIRPQCGIYDYQAKYLSDQTQYYCPAPLLDAQRTQLQEWAIAAHRALGARHYSRADFRLSPTGQLYFLELNTLPGMSANSLMPVAAKSAGMTLTDLCCSILKSACVSLVKR